jgi:hypothetical protein
MYTLPRDLEVDARASSRVTPIGCRVSETLHYDERETIAGSQGYSPLGDREGFLSVPRQSGRNIYGYW